MKVKAIEISGFRGVQGSIRIPFGSGFTVISGRNGSGKSTICDALEYALSGGISRFQSSTNDKRDISEKGETIDNYLWWRGPKHPQQRIVRVHFCDDDGEDRGFISIDSTSRQSEMDEQLLYDRWSAPPFPMIMLCQTGILRDGLIENLSTDVSETERFDFVNRAVGTTELFQLETRASDFQAILKKNFENQTRSYNVLREEISQLTSLMSEARTRGTAASSEKLEDALKRAAEFVASNSVSVTEIISGVRSSIYEINRELPALQRLHADLTTSAEKSAEVDRLQGICDAAKAELQRAEDEVKAADENRVSSSNLLKVEEQKAPRRASLGQLREHGGRLGLIDGKCPLCGSAISLDVYQAHLNEIESEVRKHGEELSRLVRLQADTAGRYANARRNFDSRSLEYSQALSEVETAKANTTQLQSEAKELNVDFSVEAVERRLSERRTRLKSLEGVSAVLEVSIALDQIRELENRRAVVQREAEKCARQIEVSERALQTANTIGATARRVSREVIEEKLAALNPLLTELYGRLRPHVDYSEVSYRMRGDVRRFLRLEVGEEMNPRFTFSSGQRRALGLAFLLAVHLSRPWCKLRTLVLDDPIQHIDDYRALHLVETLACVRQLGEQVVCTTEDPALAELLCRRLRSSSAATGIRVELDYRPGSGIEISRVEEMTPFPSRVLVSA